MVLILVVVEDVLVPEHRSRLRAIHSRLNPCCGGRCSSTALELVNYIENTQVLILVVVEDVLVPQFSSLWSLVD